MSSLETQMVEQEQIVEEQQAAPENGEQLHPLALMQRGMCAEMRNLFEAFETQRDALRSGNVVRA